MLVISGLEEDTRTDREDETKADFSASEDDSDDDEDKEEVFDEDLQPFETPYVVNTHEELGQQGDACQTEEVADENKSIIWALVKQVRMRCCSTVGVDGGCRVGKVRAGTTSPMPDHNGFKTADQKEGLLLTTFNITRENDHKTTSFSQF